MGGQSLLEVLRDVGLSEKEAQIYLAALSVGPASALQIARAAEVRRTTTYSILESLQRYGLIRIEARGFKRVFVAESPEHLEALLEKRRERFREALPQFQALQNFKGDAGFLKYYEGLRAVKNVYEELLTSVRPKDDYLILGDLDPWYELDPKFFEDFIRRRAKLGLKIRMLATDSKLSRQRLKHQHIYRDTVGILPKSVTLTTNLVVIPKRVVIHQLIPPVMALTIENPSVVQMHRELFEIAWMGRVE